MGRAAVEFLGCVATHAVAEGQLANGPPLVVIPDHHCRHRDRTLLATVRLTNSSCSRRAAHHKSAILCGRLAPAGGIWMPGRGRKPSSMIVHGTKKMCRCKHTRRQTPGKAAARNKQPDSGLASSWLLQTAVDNKRSPLLGGYLGEEPPPTSARMLQRKSISTIPIPPLSNSRRNCRQGKKTAEGGKGGWGKPLLMQEGPHETH